METRTTRTWVGLAGLLALVAFVLVLYHTATGHQLPFSPSLLTNVALLILVGVLLKR